MKKIFGIVILLCFISPSYGQSESISVHSIVNFYKYNDENIKNTDAVDFILEVKNNSSKPIPDLGVDNRSKYVNFYINGKLNNPLSLYNGVESIYSKKIIEPGESDKLDLGGWILTEDSGIIQKYGYEFTVQWEYMKIKSEILLVNLKKKTAISVVN